MTSYGQTLDSYEPDKDYLYKIFDDYFNHPTMTKIKNADGYSIYMSKMYCLLSNKCRYLVAIVKEDFNPVKTQESLKMLRWVSFQTRTLEDQHTLPPHGYQPTAKGPLAVPITRVNITNEASEYSCSDLPITVTLLHDDKNNQYTYQHRGNVVAALETYQTLVTIKDT